VHKAWQALSWGVWLALAANVVNGLGLALSKEGNDRAKARLQREPTMYERLFERVWLAGLLLTIGGEIGNLLAYGDPNTAASVVASLGCVGVISTKIFSVAAGREPFSWRYVAGMIPVICGVVMIVRYVPKSPQNLVNLIPCPMVWLDRYDKAPCGAVPPFWFSGSTFNDTQLAPGRQVCEDSLLVVGSDYWYVTRPMFVVYTVVVLVMLAATLFTLRRQPKKLDENGVATYVRVPPAWLFLLPADIAGGFTVCSSVTVSSLLFGYAIGEGRWYVLAEPIFWAMLVVLAGTAVFQTAYLNTALTFHPAGIVVPTHYVLFTLFSIIAPSVLYQELSMEDHFALPPGAMLALFLSGIALNFIGVGILSRGRTAAPADGLRAELIDESILRSLDVALPDPAQGATDPAPGSVNPPTGAEKLAEQPASR